MTKAELIAAIAVKAGLNKADAERALNAILAAVQDELTHEGKVTLTGFGTLAVEKRQERTGRNPRTGEKLRIPAARVVKFRAGKTLKKTVH